MFLEEVDTIDGRDLMTPENTKWILISNQVMRAGLSPCVRDGPACKSKWNQLLPDYKRIADYLSRTGRNVPDYWDLSSTERRSEGLPTVFAQEFFAAIHEWYGNRPQMRPPHVRDLLSPNDRNYQAQDGEQEGQEDNSEEEAEDPMDFATQQTPEASEETAPPRSPPLTSRTPSRGPAASMSGRTPSSQPFAGVPAGINPQVISSSGTSSYSLKCRPGNTAVRRKSLSGHTVIAEATKATGAVMAQHMHEIAQSSRELERSKIEVQLKLFSETMAYQRDKDLRNYEMTLAANENARLSIMKQGEMVNCLTQLSGVLSKSLNKSNGHAFPSTPEEVPTAAPASPQTTCHHQPKQVNLPATVDDIQEESNRGCTE